MAQSSHVSEKGSTEFKCNRNKNDYLLQTAIAFQVKLSCDILSGT